MKVDLEEKIKSLELVVSENSELKAQLEQMTTKANKAEAENKMLIDRWMLEKMKDAERLNEVQYLTFGIRYLVLVCVINSGWWNMAECPNSVI